MSDKPHDRYLCRQAKLIRGHRAMRRDALASLRGERFHYFRCFRPMGTKTTFHRSKIETSPRTYQFATSHKSRKRLINFVVAPQMQHSLASAGMLSGSSSMYFNVLTAELPYLSELFL
jgi:hypothetical protein